jgi:predicted nuclease with TOPRIM domain
MSFAGGECQEKIFPYYAAERAILDHLAKMLSVMTSQKPDVVDPRVELEGKKAAITTKIENLIDALQTMKSEQIRERITKLQIEYDKLDEQVRRVIDPKIQMSGAVEALEMFAKLKQPSLLEVDERLMIQTMMKRVIESVNCSLDGPTVAIKYHSHVRNHVDFINVRPFMDVGGFKKKVPA